MRAPPLALVLGLICVGCLPELEEACGEARPCELGACVQGICLEVEALAPPPPADVAVEVPAADAALGDGAPACAPRPEECDGLDDDCDGRVDEAPDGPLSRPCGGAGESVGQCRPGRMACLDGRWGPCEGGTAPAPERCDGLDDDCDGAVDEALDEGCYTGPADTVGRGSCVAGRRACVGGVSGPACRGEVLPARDICDGADNDCDGRVDEGQRCGCSDGATRACTAGPPEAVGVGRCHAGVQRCERGRWGPCEGDRPPTSEACDGLDDDCDGVADEGLDGGDCAVGVGRCRRPGVLACDGGGLRCVAEPAAPGLELCNDADDDCDGRADEGFAVGAACVAGEGACEAEGFRRCDPEGAVECFASEPPPSSERCNGIDDDCDARVDEGEAGPLRVACYRGPPGTAGVGACRPGTAACREGAPEAECLGAVEPGAELCDGVDNDCDGAVDERVDGCACAPGVTRACYEGPAGTEGVGPCRAGRRACDATGRFGPCLGAVGPSAEVCGGDDEDCDGRIDEAVPGTGRRCTRGVGACAREGRTVCGAEGLRCDATPGDPSVEACDGVDDDCDGIVDEALAEVGQPCAVGVGACAADGLTACEAGRGLVCVAEPRRPRAEVCDGVDDDCDGVIDEGVRDPCGGCAEVLPPDVCDGRDSDCDGMVDEDHDALVGTRCEVGAGACAAEGLFACAAGGLICVTEAAPAQPEICNGVDDDCDGRVDDGASCPLPRVAEARCVEGRCALDACEAGFWDDDGEVDNGCERGCAAPMVEAPLAPGREAVTRRGGGETVTAVVGSGGGLRMFRAGRLAGEAPAPLEGSYAWPDLALAGGRWTLVARHQTPEGRRIARLHLGRDGRAEAQLLPGVDAGAPTARAFGDGVVVAYLAAPRPGAPRALYLATEDAPAVAWAVPDLAPQPTAGVAVLIEPDRVRILAPVVVAGEPRLRALRLEAGRLGTDGEVAVVGPVVGAPSAARSGGGGIVLYVGGGGLHRHPLRLGGDAVVFGPRASARVGDGVARGSVARTAQGYVAVSSAPGAEAPCQLHLLRFDGAEVAAVPLARPACDGAWISAGDDGPLLTWVDEQDRVWLAEGGCQ